MEKIISEKQLHKQICDYLHMQYPKVLFNTDMSGIKLTMGQAIQAKKLRSCDGWPDIIIYEPRLKDNHWSGLFLEIKKETPYKKNGELKKMIRYEHIGGVKVPYDHLERQNQMHRKLKNRGFKGGFVWYLELAKLIIDNYLN